MFTTIPKTKKDFAWMHWGVKDIEEAVKASIERMRQMYADVKTVPDPARTFENTMYALETAGTIPDDVLQLVAMLMNTSPDKEIRETAHRVIDEAQKEILDITYDENIYKAVRYYADRNSKKEKLLDEEKKLLKESLRGYKRAGFELSKAKRDQLKSNLKELAELSNKFEKNINDYQDHIVVTPADLEGLPMHYIENLKKDKDGNYIVTLQNPDYIPFMQNSKNAKKREELAIKNYKEGGTANLRILEKVLALRNKNAKLLGYQSHAHFVIEENMAKKPEAVLKLIEGLAKKVYKKRLQDLQDLQKLKASDLGDPKAEIRYYDIAYYGKKLQMERHNIDKEEIRKYFPFENVKAGVFEAYSKLFSVTFERIKGYPVLHPDVELYQVRDKKGAVVGYFSLDLYPREGKFTHAAVLNAFKSRSASFRSSEYLPAYSAMMANFPKPSKKTPSLLSHGEVTTFFHEFGHIMHGVLSRARYASQSGTSVAHDFVEVPSQMFENWAWDKKIIAAMSSHYQTQAPMPKKMIDDLVSAKHFMRASHIMGQAVYGMFDMKLHMGGKVPSLNKLFMQMSRQYLGIELPKESLFPAGFGHIMGYDAGYYGYMWSLVYSFDIFSVFKKEGLLNPKVGERFKVSILEKGGSREEMDSMVEFLGRKPNNKAFLEEMGLK